MSNETQTNEIKKIDIGEKWSLMGRRLAIALPQWILNRLDKRSEGKGPVVKVIPFVIALLSLASITNLAGRAYIHHSDPSAYATGAGIAVLVPVAVIAAMLIEGWWAYVFWGMAFIFAAVSGTIQYNIYLMPHSGGMGIAEAIAFGYGVPVSEVMLAIMETRLVLQYDRRKAKEAADAVAIAKAEKEAAERKAEAERKRIADEQEAAAARQRQLAAEEAERAYNEQKRAIELEAYRIETAQRLELSKERALTDLRIKEAQAEVRSTVAPAMESATGSAGSQKPKPAAPASKREIQLAMIEIYREEPALSDDLMATRIGKSKKTVQDYLADLADKKVVEIKKVGRGKTVTVNGKYPAFERGEL